ncbi:phage head morphogenesis protein [Listeria ilorinensis]|uniref:phage head morphogenesis protein n=1 Tax=Listeria ilorinensis TaxID=2867439 RepID=UPI001EF64999|nr:minor capsid protein [Listeria ilorinensis]
MANKRRVPKTRYPFNVERSYAKELVGMVREVSEILFKELEGVQRNIEEYQNVLSDSKRSDGVSDAVKAALDKVKAISLGVFNNRKFTSAASKFVRAVNSTNKVQTDRQLKVGGIQPQETEPWLQEFMDSKVTENVSYIKSIGDDYLAKTEQIIMRSITNGENPKKVKEDLVKATGVSENKAKFIARDQTGTIFGQMTASRHMKAGIPGFRWSNSGDSRVRPTHQDRNNRVYSYSDPNAPIPGVEYNCRCVAIPVFDLNEIPEYTDADGFYNIAKHSIDEVPTELQDILKKHITKESIVIDNKINGAAAYSPKSNVVMMNPYHSEFKNYDLKQAILHEYGHKVDISDLKISSNNDFKIALTIDSKVANYEELRKVMQIDEYAHNPFLSDIFGALTSNEVFGYATHDDAYWKRNNNVAKEVFANMFALKAVKNAAALKVIEKQFPMVYAKFNTLLSEAI